MNYFSIFSLIFLLIQLAIFDVSRLSICRDVLRVQIETNFYAFCSSTLLQLFQWGKEESRKRNVQCRVKVKKMEKFTCFLLLLLNLDILQASELIKVSRANFIPFGPQNNDNIFPNQDDSSIQFLWINSNGIISFDGSVLNYTALAFPTKNFISVAPFWADVDITNSGNIFYRKIDDENSLKKINDEINAAFPGINFSCKWALHETWIDVPEYEPPVGTDFRNTFQAVIATDFQYSFTIFNYEILTWSKGNAQAGFNSGDGVNYVILPGSFTNDIVNIAQNSNVGIAGKWIYRIEGSEIIDAECSNEKLEISPGSVLFTGGEQVNISGICFKKDDNIQVLIDEYLVFKCEFKTKQLCVFTTTFLRKTGKLSLKISVNGKMVAQDEMTSRKLSLTQKIFGLNSYVFTNQTGDIRIEWPNDNTASYSVYLLEIFLNTSKWTLLKDGISTNFTFIETSLLFQDSSDDVRYCFLMIRNELDFELKWKYEFQFFILNWKMSNIDYQIQQWYSSQFDPEIFDQNLPYCWKAIPLDGSGRLPNLFHDFVIDEFCNPNNPSGCGLKFASYVCYNSVYFYRYENFYIRRQCCYGTNFILNSDAGGLLYMNAKFVWEHFVNDIRPFLLTCILSHNKQLYFEKRPIDSGNRWQPVFFGGYSSYFITYDKLKYTFNGFGEYDLMSIAEESFFVQIRMTPLLSQGVNSITYMRAIAIKSNSHADTIQFEMSSKNEIVMYLNGVLANLNEYESDRATEVDGAIVFISKNSISISYSLGVYLELRTNEYSDSFSVLVSVSEKYAGKLTGLMGNMNTRQDDEFALPNRTLLSLNSNDDKQIFSYFGKNWITTEESSIFTYSNQEAHSSFQNLSFVPAFISEGFVFVNKTLEQIATSICQGNVECLFQIYISNDPSRSGLLLDFYEQTILFNGIIANQTNLICRSIEVPNGAYNVSYHLDFGLGYFFYCNNGFSLDGDSRIKCSNLSQIPSCLMDSVETTSSSATQLITTIIEKNNFTKPTTSMNLISQNFSHLKIFYLNNKAILRQKRKKNVVVYNFCGLIDNTTQCRTSKTKEEYDECSKGNFLLASSNESKEKGKYSIKFYSSIVCEEINCEEANDFIKIIHTKATSSGICKINVLEVNLANIGEKNKWKEKEAIVEEESNFLINKT
ncbi:sushi domain-containing 2-like [Brachionus plicatilis]|uniref:Sushi domain-containing 2-like n=1 Tax=Brachionus plicatilis TaxID=10195 RepID=A0A3M7RB56_BRAPC|nr:sushi domain-containing 2-like [Brachionus plicatilis]